MTSIKIAHWCSKGARWEAILDRGDYGYRLSEQKNGYEVGASFRPFSMLATDDDAKTYYQAFVAQSFDVPMKRVA